MPAPGRAKLGNYSWLAARGPQGGGRQDYDARASSRATATARRSALLLWNMS